jgi:transposase
MDVLETRDKSALKAWLEAGVASGLLGELEEVTTDMWDAYASAAREVLGSGIRIVVDRFHVIRLFHDCLGKARLEIQRSLPKEAAVELKGSRWLWVTNPENLSTQDQKQLRRLQQQFPGLARLSEHREQLRQIFENREIRTAAVGTIHLRKWIQQGRQLGLTALEPFYKTVENWMKKIANYFVSRSTNGRTEGFNRNLRCLLWRACGMRNFNHFRLRVLHALG